MLAWLAVALYLHVSDALAVHADLLGQTMRCRFAGSNEIDVQTALAECNATEGNCQPGWFYAEMPQRTVFVDDFEITKYEITNAAYNTCVAAGICRKVGDIGDGNIAYDPGFFVDNYPVVAVKWDDANTFCNWVGGRLPTEAESEKAARGTDGRRYPWGDNFESSKANFSNMGPAPMGSFPDGASPTGVMDMAGNVFEWTGTQSGNKYALRGGGWNNYHFRGRTTDRGTLLIADFHHYDVGFRCAR